MASQLKLQRCGSSASTAGKDTRGTPGGFGFPVVFLMFAGFCLGGKVEDCFSLMK